MIITYSKFISELDSRGNNYEHVFAAWSCNGTSWSSVDITPGVGFDAAFPSVADWGDDEIHFTYVADSLAGNAVSGTHEPIPVAYMYRSIWPGCYDCCYSPPTPPVLLSPPNGAVGVQTTVLLDWSFQWPPANHRVQVAEDEVFTRLILDITINGTSTSYELEGLSNQSQYFWRVNASSAWGQSDWSEIWTFHTIVTDVDEDEIVIPSTPFLYQSHPNPFNSMAIVEFQIASKAKVSLVVHDLLGKQVATLVDESLSPGRYRRRWDATGQPSGVYFYRLEAGKFVETKKLVLVR